MTHSRHLHHSKRRFKSTRAPSLSYPHDALRVTALFRNGNVVSDFHTFPCLLPGDAILSLFLVSWHLQTLVCKDGEEFFAGSRFICGANLSPSAHQHNTHLTRMLAVEPTFLLFLVHRHYAPTTVPWFNLVEYTTLTWQRQAMSLPRLHKASHCTGALHSSDV